MTYLTSTEFVQKAWGEIHTGSRFGTGQVLLKHPTFGTYKLTPQQTLRRLHVLDSELADNYVLSSNRTEYNPHYLNTTEKEKLQYSLEAEHERIHGYYISDYVVYIISENPRIPLLCGDFLYTLCYYVPDSELYYQYGYFIGAPLFDE